jgi:hypothetical protein
MRALSAAVLTLALAAGTASAQGVNPHSPPASKDAGTTHSKQPQPQGRTGPTTTTTGGAPAASPQGDTPAGMQPRPHGAPEQAVDPKK